MIKILRLSCPIPILCRVLKVSESGYYAWLNRKPPKRQQKDAKLKIEIQAARKRTRCTCGVERLQKDMSDNGVSAGVSRIRKLRKELGIKCKQTKKYKATTDSEHKLPVAENILEQRFEATEPNKV